MCFSHRVCRRWSAFQSFTLSHSKDWFRIECFWCRHWVQHWILRVAFEREMDRSDQSVTTPFVICYTSRGPAQHHEASWQKGRSSHWVNFMLWVRWLPLSGSTDGGIISRFKPFCTDLFPLEWWSRWCGSNPRHVYSQDAPLERWKDAYSFWHMAECWIRLWRSKSPYLVDLDCPYSFPTSRSDIVWFLDTPLLHLWPASGLFLLLWYFALRAK